MGKDAKEEVGDEGDEKVEDEEDEDEVGELLRTCCMPGIASGGTKLDRFSELMPNIESAPGTDCSAGCVPG